MMMSARISPQLTLYGGTLCKGTPLALIKERHLHRTKQSPLTRDFRVPEVPLSEGLEEIT